MLVVATPDPESLSENNVDEMFEGAHVCDARVRMTQGVHGNPSTKVEELSVFSIPYPGSTTVREHEWRSRVNAEDVLLPESEGASGSRRFGSSGQVMGGLEVASARCRTMLKEANEQWIKQAGQRRTSDAALEANRALRTALLPNPLEPAARRGL